MGIMVSQRSIAGLSVLAAVLLMTTGWLFLQRSQAGDVFAQCRKTNVSGGMESFGTAFTLTNQYGERVTDEQVFSKPSLLYFGYTYCPDVCPLDTARNAEAVDLLAAQGEDVQSVFVTVDPNRDTPEVVRNFTDSISTDMIGLTGSTAEIDAVSKGWRNYYALNNEEDQEYYLVDHMTNTFLVLPEAGTVELFNREVTADEIAERTSCFLNSVS